MGFLPTDALVVALVAAATIGAARLLTGERVDPLWTTREADGAHLAMNSSMAVMLTPLWGPSAWWAVLVVSAGGATATVAALLRGPADTARRIGLVHHAVAFAAMGLALTQLHRPSAHSAVEHGHTPAGGAGLAVLAVVLVAWFAVDAIATVVVATVAPVRLLPTGSRRTGLRVAAFPHVVMGTAMVDMLWPLL